MKLKYTLATTYISSLGLALLLSSNLNAQSTCSANASPGATSCTNLIINSPTANIDISGTVSSAPPPTGIGPAIEVASSGSVASLNVSSSGIVSSDRMEGIWNRGGVITSLTNSGNIASTNFGVSSGIENSTGGVISSLTNTGVIGGLSRGITNANSTIGSITNGGTIGNANYGVVNQFGTINSITNTGVINANGANSNSHAIYNIGGTIGNITNSGSINSVGIDSLGPNASYAIFNTGTINTITNTATVGTPTSGIYGASGVDINNTGTIRTLNNAQNNLFLQGNLPNNYNVIINSANNYGKLSVYSPTGIMNFGISPLSAAFTPGTTSYAGVLTGFTSANLSATAGTYGGAFITTQWQLVAAGNQFNLTTNTPAAAVAPVINGSAAGQNLAGSITATYNAILAYSVANPAAPANPRDFMVNLNSSGAALFGANQALFSQIVPTLTSTQAQQLEQAHAEGYSSNMTIGLEQMAHITNTVMDRIHAPMSSSPSTKVYQDDQGRYIWADAAAVKGTVNNNNNLAGFGYNLYDIIFGGDIKRSKEGGFGVFAGTGTTSMTESQQVTQNFNTTNFYAGLYGARNFDEQIKLSGALGYMYGSTSANRNIPDIGVIAASNTTSSYKTNGVYGAAKLAKAYQAESFTVSPFIGASYSQLWMGGTSEQGGNTPFNYGISGATAYTAVTFAGADFIYPLLKGTNDPLSLIGFYKFGYDWFANSNSAHTITASGPTGSFAQVGANMGPVSNMVGLGIQGGITKEVSARIGAVASYNTYGHEYGGGAELRFKF